MSTASRPLGVGIVGLSASGGWAAGAHVPALASLDGVELRALSASSNASAKAAGDAHGVSLTFGSAEELAQCEEVDLVVVAVKVPHHRELVLPALEAGKMVLCEWPLGNGLAEAEELAAVAEARGVRTFVGLQARSAPLIRQANDLVEQGYIGEVLSTSLVASGARWGGTITDDGVYLLDRNNGATMLSIPFGHTVDALTSVLGEFTELSATTATRRPRVHNTDSGELIPMTADDQVAVTGVLAGGAVASVHFRGGLSRGTNFHWEINGTDGDLVLSGESGHLQMGQVRLQGAHGQDTALAALPLPPEYDDVPSLSGRSTETAYTVGHAYSRLLRDVTEGTRVVPDFAQAARSQRMLDRIERAAITGERQYLAG